MEVVYGIHPVREVLRRGARRCGPLLLARPERDPAVREIVKLARERAVRIDAVSKDDVARRVPGATHQGVALEAEEIRVLDIAEALAELPVSRETVWLGLDEITDPHNLGAILRNAAAFGVGALLIPGRRSAQVTPLVQKIASGAAEYVPVVDAGNLNQAIRRVKDREFWVYGAAVEGAPLAEATFAGPALLLIGSEGSGLRRRTREIADELVAIPQAPGGVASLNASCASAVLLFELTRRLRS